MNSIRRSITLIGYELHLSVIKCIFLLISSIHRLVNVRINRLMVINSWSAATHDYLWHDCCYLFVARILLLVCCGTNLLVSCGTNLIVGQMLRESYCWYAVARVLVASQPASQRPASQPASQPASSQPANLPAKPCRAETENRGA